MKKLISYEAYLDQSQFVNTGNDWMNDQANGRSGTKEDGQK